MSAALGAPPGAPPRAHRGFFAGPTGGRSMVRLVALLFALDASLVVVVAGWVALRCGASAPAILARLLPYVATLAVSGAVALLTRTTFRDVRPAPAGSPTPPADAA